jgi:hypothetical protein
MPGSRRSSGCSTVPPQPSAHPQLIRDPGLNLAIFDVNHGIITGGHVPLDLSPGPHEHSDDALVAEAGREAEGRARTALLIVPDRLIDIPAQIYQPPDGHLVLVFTKPNRIWLSL